MSDRFTIPDQRPSPGFEALVETLMKEITPTVPQTLNIAIHYQVNAYEMAKGHKPTHLIIGEDHYFALCGLAGGSVWMEEVPVLAQFMGLIIVTVMGRGVSVGELPS